MEKEEEEDAGSDRSDNEGEEPAKEMNDSKSLLDRHNSMN